MKTIEISEEGVLNAYKNGSDSERIFLENLIGKDNMPPLNITDRVKTMHDIFRIQGISIADFRDASQGLSDDEVAYREAKLIAKTLNEGTALSIAETNVYKYFPWFRVTPDPAKPPGFGLSFAGCDRSFAGAHIGARLAFKSASLARYAGETFPDVYERLFA